MVRGCAGEDAWGSVRKSKCTVNVPLNLNLNILQFVAPALPMLEAVSLKLIALDGCFLP